MKIDEFLKDEKNLDQAAKCKDINEFKKFIDKNDVFYFTEEQLKKAWNYVRACSPSQDGSLDDDALEVVSGGLVDCYVDVDFGDVVHRDYERKNRYDERNDSIVRRTNYGDISDDGMISF